jgi:hypothetical protein
MSIIARWFLSCWAIHVLANARASRRPRHWSNPNKVLTKNQLHNSSTLASHRQLQSFAEVAKLTASNGGAGELFGREGSLAFLYPYIAIGNWPHNHNKGAVYVFLDHDGNGSWTEIAILTAGDGAADNDAFGVSVDMYENIIVVGADQFYSGGKGFASIFYINEVTEISQIAKLTASDGFDNEHFGRSIAVDGNTIVVGAWGANEDNGAAYVFQDSNGNQEWSEVTILMPSSNTGETAFFGFTVDTLDGHILVAALGQNFVYVFDEASPGNWTEIAKLKPLDGVTDAGFGERLAMAENWIVVAASLHSTVNGQHSGAAYVYNNISGQWTAVARLLASDGADYNEFGFSIDISVDASMIAVGAPRNDDRGSAYIFQKGLETSSGWTHIGTPFAEDGVDNYWFGVSVAISSKNIVIGATGADDNGSNSGAAYVFSIDASSTQAPTPTQSNSISMTPVPSQEVSSSRGNTSAPGTLATSPPKDTAKRSPGVTIAAIVVAGVVVIALFGICRNFRSKQQRQDGTAENVNSPPSSQERNTMIAEPLYLVQSVTAEALVDPLPISSDIRLPNVPLEQGVDFKYHQKSDPPAVLPNYKDQTRSFVPRRNSF